jgi:hypothetical protein
MSTNYLKKVDFFAEHMRRSGTGKAYPLIKNWEEKLFENADEARRFLNSDEVKLMAGTLPLGSPNIIIKVTHFYWRLLYKILPKKFSSCKNLRPVGCREGGRNWMSYHYFLMAAGALTGDLEMDHDLFLQGVAHERHHNIPPAYCMRYFTDEATRRFVDYCSEVCSDVLAYHDLWQLRGGFAPEYEYDLLNTWMQFEQDYHRDGTSHPSREYRRDLIKLHRFDDDLIDNLAAHCNYRDQKTVEKIKKKYQYFYYDFSKERR